MMLWLWEGSLKTTVLPRKRVMRGEFNTGHERRTVFLRTSPGNFFRRTECRQFAVAGVTPQNTQFTAKFNHAVALTPQKSAAIISVSVCSAEVCLGFYV